MKETICWNCAKACGKCPWSDGSFTPVDGWIATPTKIKFGCKIENSYLVKNCPLFVSKTWSSISVKALAKILNINIRTFFRLTDEDKISKARKCGYDLKIEKEKLKKNIY